jgi:photosystem II stability/assembly factor-like uncharacterized protein
LQVWGNSRFGLVKLASMIHTLAIALSISLLPVAASAQWQLQHSGSDAGLRGVHAVNASIAWATGTDGTVLHTTDGGAHWEKCAVPPGAEKLDFRAVWAWSDQQAVVMSSGPGDLSRVYRTTDGCNHWTEERRNSRKDGFWDALWFQSKDSGELIGDPVDGHFYRETYRPDHGWEVDPKPCAALTDESAFAASNSSLFVLPDGLRVLGTGGRSGARVLVVTNNGCVGVDVPIASGNDSSGVFSVAFRDLQHGVAVGGDYKKPNSPAGTAAWTADGGRHWTAAQQPPHGYRSAVAWNAAQKEWIAAGTNGTDISKDDGESWQRFDDGNWNALALPFIVGPKGRIGRLP